MIPNFHVTYTGLPAPGVTKRETDRVVKKSMIEVAQFWHRRIRPKHFTEAGAREYRYDERTAKYQKRKLAAVGHQAPLRWTDTSRVLTTIPKFKYRLKTATVDMNAARGLRRRPKGKRTDMRLELSATSAGDRRAMLKLLQRVFVRNISQVRVRKRKRIK